MIETNKMPLSQYFELLEKREILQVAFVQDYFELWFDRGYIRPLWKTVLRNDEGAFHEPQKSMEGCWHLVNLINTHATELEETNDERIIVCFDNGAQVEARNDEKGPPGDCFQIRVEGYPCQFI